MACASHRYGARACSSKHRDLNWKKELEANVWQNIYLPSAESAKYLDFQYARYRAILVELGLVK